MYMGVARSAYTTYQQLPFVHLSSPKVHTQLMLSALGRTILAPSQFWPMQATKGGGAVTYQGFSGFRHV